MSPMALHRTNTYKELLSNLRIGIPKRNQTQNIALALTQLVGLARIVAGGKTSAKRRLQIGIAGGRPAHGLDQLSVGSLLQHVATHPRLQGTASESRLILHRQDDDLGLR